MVEDAWGEPVDPNKVEAALKKNPDARIVAFVQAETSTGCAIRREGAHRARAQARRARDRRRRSTSLGGTPVLVDEWGIDAVYSASQKCLSCTPGLSPVSFSERVVDYVKARKDKIHSWFMDIGPAS